VKNVLRLSRI
jgi:hypothetical protein